MTTRPRPPMRAVFREHPNGAECLALDRWMFSGLGPPGEWSTVRPGAFGLSFDVPRCGIGFRGEDGEDYWGDRVPSSIIEGGISVMDLRGPIEHHSCWYWNSYEDLVRAIDMSCAHKDVAKTVLRVDSPGGVAAGMPEAHEEIRRIIKKYGKDVIAYVDGGNACSAAYHVSSACSEVWMSEGAQVGSIGVILCTIDETEALDRAGLKIRYVVTGKRKADLHPGSPVTDEVLRVAQEKVDYSGRLFFEAVASARGLTAAKVEGYQAGVFCGAAAQKAKLVDGIAAWPKFLSLVRSSIKVGAPPVATVPEASAAGRMLSSLGASKGGHAAAASLTISQRTKRAKIAARARWDKHPASTSKH